jgi:hypothetical protein
MAFALLAVMIVLAPIAGGSSNVRMLPALSLIACMAYCACVLGCKKQERRLPLLGFSLVLLGLGLFTLCQIVMLPDALLAFVSPKANELRNFVNPDPRFAPLSYEPGVTAGESAKLIICALVSVVAYERAKTRNTSYRFIVAVLVAILASIAVGGVHRIAHLQKMLGLVTSSLPAHQLLTTFVNPNHAAGFTAWGVIIALGLALEEPRRHIRIGFGILGLICAAVCVLCASRGGIFALAIGLVGFGGTCWIKKTKTGHKELIPWIALTAGVSAVVAFFARDRMVREFTSAPDNPFGLEGKLSAIRGVSDLVADHLWLGIGRGSYISLFSHYKTAQTQFIYTHPENLFIQLICDWGILIGASTFLGLIYIMYRSLKRAHSYSEIGAIVGLWGLLIQNLADFSFELLGVSIPAIAILATLGLRRKDTSIKLGLGSYPRLTAVLFIPIGFLLVANYYAFERGILEDDIASLKKKPDSAIAQRHPANAYAFAQMAFHAEHGKPPKIREALRWANIALYLAPSYAEAHLVAGRLLLKAGHRRQGFEQIRTAWARTNQKTPEKYFEQIAYFARTTEDLLEAIPRRDPIADIPDEIALCKLILWLKRNKKGALGSQLLNTLPNIDTIDDPDSLSWIAWAAYRHESPERARAAIKRQRKLAKDETLNLELESKVLIAQSQWSEALNILDRTMKTQDPAQRMRTLVQTIQLCLRSKDFARAQAYVLEFETVMAPTFANQLQLDQQKIKIALKMANPGKALALIDKAIGRSPSNMGLRLKRATIHWQAHRPRMARLDLEFILRMEPEHAQAKALLKRVLSQEQQTSGP